MAKTDVSYVTDGAFDFSGGVDSSRVTTIQSALNPNGLPRNGLAWLNNATVRNGGITQRTGFQPLVKLIKSGRWQGGFMYEPDSANPYLVFQVDGIPYSALMDAPYTVTDLSGGNPKLRNPPGAEMAFFAQGENILVIQAGDYFTAAVPTLPLFWNGTTLRRSIGITTATAPANAPGINELPAATTMWYHGQRFWYAQGRAVSAGDIAGGPSGTAAQHFRDSIISVTENPLCFGGDGFTLPTNSGNIRALREEVNLNESVANSRLLIWTRKSVFALSVPVTRKDWINATSNNQPLLVPVQKVNGAVGDRCLVPSNGDWFYQAFEPSIRSLISAVRYYSQWGNTPISQNENRALQLNNRGLMRFSGGIAFDNRMFQLVLPELAADGINVIHRAILPLDFDIVSNMASTTALTNVPVWEGAYDGLLYLQPFEGDFGGLPRAFVVVISEVDGSLNVWEMTTGNRFENGDNRITWSPEFPAFTWASSTSGSLEFLLKQLEGGEAWIDKIFGTVDFDVYYRCDADPCWRHWMRTSFCVKRDCRELDDPCVVQYPPPPFREGYVYTVAFPKPPQSCDSMNVRPSTLGYQFQVKIVLKGWCRIRGLLLYAQPREKPQFQGVGCPPTGGPEGMRKLPNLEFLSPVSTFLPPAPPPPPPPPTPVLPGKAVIVSPANGAGAVDPQSVLLSWSNGGGATSYDVYLNGVLQGNQAGPTFNPGVLIALTAYTWRIDSKNSDGTTTGDTWTFTTTAHALVLSWASRVVVNGGAAPGLPTQRSLHVFCVGLDANSLTSLMYTVNCIANDSLTAAITPLIVGPGNDPWTNHNFVGGDLTVNGLKGDGATKYLNSGVVPSTAFVADTNSAGISVYNTFSSVDTATDVGSYGAAASYFAIFAAHTTVQLTLYCYGAITGFIQGANLTGGLGFSCGVRTAANAIALYKASSTVPFTSPASGNGAPEATIPAFPCYVFAADNANTPQGGTFSPKRYSFVAIHQGLTSTQAQNLFNLVQALRTALGGGFV